MSLVNFPKVRIRKIEDKGFIIEVQRSLKWVHIISYYGLPRDPFYYQSYNSALEDLCKEIKWEIIKNSINESNNI